MSTQNALRRTTEESLVDLSEQLRNFHYAYSAHYPVEQVVELDRDALRAFNATWDNLQTGTYLGATNRTCERRICKFQYRQQDRA